MKNKQFVVFTDLDGTLLDHHSYSFEAALPALNMLKQRHIPVVLNSSKTRPEMEQLRIDLENTSPFICENGGALIIPATEFGTPQEQVINFAEPIEQIIAVLADLRQQGFAFRSFNDMSEADVADITGLSLSRAKSAKQRLATEPLLWNGSDEELLQFEAAVGQRNLQLVKGGRFYHVMGQYDKGDAMAYLMERYRESDPQKQWCSVALGDSNNDERMLELADYSMVIKGVNSDSVLVNSSKPNLVRSNAPGPEGWNETITKLLQNEA